jgi:hypothetical protein
MSSSCSGLARIGGVEQCRIMQKAALCLWFVQLSARAPGHPIINVKRIGQAPFALQEMSITIRCLP